MPTWILVAPLPIVVPVNELTLITLVPLVPVAVVDNTWKNPGLVKLIVTLSLLFVPP